MRLVVREQPLGVRRQPEEVGLLLGPRHRGARLDRDPGTVGEDLELVVGEEALVAHRVPAGVRVQVDVARGVHPVPDLDGRLDVVGVGGADEAVERDAELLLHRLEGVGVAPGEVGGRDALGGGRLGHLEPVHVGSGQEADVEAVEPLEPRNRVGGDLLVGVADVRCPVGVVDGGGDVVRLSGSARPRAGGRHSPGGARPCAGGRHSAHLSFTLRCGREFPTRAATGA